METKKTNIQKLRELDEYLFKTIAMVQEIVYDDKLPHGLAFSLDVEYQHHVTALYNLVKGWVE